MAGLLPPSPPAQDAPPDAESVDASPEEQAQYEEIVENASSLIYSPQVFPGILRTVMTADDPVDGVADVVANVFSMLVRSAANEGAELDEDILLHAGAEVVETLCDALERGGVATFDADQVEATFLNALDLYRQMQMAAGGLDQQRHRAEWEGLVAADQSGQLGGQLGGLAQAVRSGSEPMGGSSAPPRGNRQQRRAEDAKSRTRGLLR